MRQDKTRQDKTRQDKTRQDKTRQDAVRIFCVDHRETVPEDVLPEGVDAIGVGKRRQAGEFWDGEGEHIAGLNPHLNEITAQWWVWKHPEARRGAEFVGFCHYRRFLRFTPERERRCSAQTLHLRQVILKQRYKPLILQKAFSAHEAERVLVSSRAEGALPHTIVYGGTSDKGGIARAVETFGMAQERWIRRAIEFLRETAPGACVDFIENELFNGRVFYACNMYVVRVEQFERMCERLFPAFRELAEEWLQDGDPKVNPREVGFIAEAVVGVYWRWLEERQHANFLHCPCFYFSDAEGYGKWYLFFSRLGYRFLPDVLIRPLTAFHKWLVIRKQKH